MLLMDTQYSVSGEYAMIPFVWDDTRLVVLVANCESYKAGFKARPGGWVVGQLVIVD